MQPATITGLNAEAEGLTLKNLSMTVPAWESGLIAKTAKPLAEITADGQKHHVAFVNPIGKGCTVYFGAAIMTTIGDWREMRYTSANAPQLKIISQLLDVLFQRAGITPIATADLKATSIQVRQNGLSASSDWFATTSRPPTSIPASLRAPSTSTANTMSTRPLGRRLSRLPQNLYAPICCRLAKRLCAVAQPAAKLVAAVTPGEPRLYHPLALDTAATPRAPNTPFVCV